MIYLIYLHSLNRKLIKYLINQKLFSIFIANIFIYLKPKVKNRIYYNHYDYHRNNFGQI